MESQISYLKSVIEGHDSIEPWREWFARNEEALSSLLNRGEFLRLKANRIREIPSILKKFGVNFIPSTRYDWLGGIDGRCRDCGAELEKSPRFEEFGGFIDCPNGCFHMHVLVRPPTNSA